MSNLAHQIDEKPRTKDVILEENVSFDSLLLPEKLLKGLNDCGFRKPSPIQLKAIPPGRCGFDLVIKSKSGTGKTLVFSTIALEVVDTMKENLQVLILTPTREIAVQIRDVLKSLSRHMSDIKIGCFIGGLPVEDDIKNAKGCHIAVGAPGRVKHLISQGSLKTDSVRAFILDEADKLMETSFQVAINQIYHTLPLRKQIIAASATYHHQLDTFLSKYMLSPIHISAEIETPVLLGLKQFVLVVKSSSNVIQLMKAKNEALIQLLTKIPFTQCLVFTNFQTRAESISNILNQKGWKSNYISAAQSQTKRLEVVNDLKEFKNRIMLSTDLAARGIDAANIDLVINFDVPNDAVTYLHRMGRAGRYGSSGICINLALQGGELALLQSILGTIGSTTMSIAKLPDLNDGNLDLWNVDPKKLEQLHGVVTDNVGDVSDKIKKEIMAFKDQNKKLNKQQQKINTKNSNQTVKQETDIVMDAINSSITEVDDLPNNFVELDSDALLQSIINGDEMPKSEITKTNSTVDLKPLFDLLETQPKLEPDCENTAHTSDEDCKKRKRNEGPQISPPDASKSSHKEKRRVKDETDITLCKNKMFSDIKKLLFNENQPDDVRMVESVNQYLNIIDTKIEIAEESVSNEIKSTEINTTLNTNIPCDSVDMEDFFKISYRYAVDLSKIHWLEHFPKEEIDVVTPNIQEIQERISCDDTEEIFEDGDYQMEDYVEEEEEEQEQIEENLENHHENETQTPLEQHFEHCYQDLSTHLWEKGLSFETVEDFDNWFYQWQQQLESVRSYVQQNIYVKEMSAYQKTKPFG